MNIPATSVDLLNECRVHGYEHQYQVGDILYRVRHLLNGTFRVDRRDMGDPWRVDGNVFDTIDDAVAHIETGLRLHLESIRGW
ncbi:MAG: hypothetical protein KAU50_06735 [Candidatus Marinimicrobia bacterium]|nr:hypothetical protein [Candidatus Neomarinimicrobiota bacterium]